MEGTTVPAAEPASLLRRLLALGIDAVLPPCCPACRARVRRQGDLCGPCWAGLAFIAEPACDRCARPVPAGPAGRILCPACIVDPPAFARARAALRYDERSAPLILALKHRDRLQGVPAFGGWMARAGQSLLEAADALVPVPLHRLRLMKRGYNQSVLLARAIATHSGTPVLVDSLRRIRATASQQRLGAEERARNLTPDAFALRKGHAARIAGKRLVLIDDVLTTGATLSACATVLCHAGATEVAVLTLARVAQAPEIPISGTSAPG